ncbi:MAG: hypothetical protein AB1330_01285 [Bacillota bacterium]
MADSLEVMRAEKVTTFRQFLKHLDDLWRRCGHQAPILRYRTMDDWEQYPVIVCRLERRYPSEGVNEKKPRLRTMLHDADNPSRSVRLMGQMFDHRVLFNIIAKSAEEADRLVDDFELFMETYKDDFVRMGVRLWFEEQLADDVETSWRDPVVVRPLYYIVRLDRIRPEFVGRLNRIDLDYELIKKE